MGVAEDVAGVGAVDTGSQPPSTYAARPVDAQGTFVHLSAALFSSFISPVRRYAAGEADIWDKSFLQSGPIAQDLVVDVQVYVLFAAICLVLLVLFRHLIAHPLGRAVLPAGKNAEAQIRKFGDSACECANYLVFTVLGCSVVLTSPWIWPSVMWWEGEAWPATTQMRDDLRCWYIMDAGRYTAALFSIVFLEHRRKDFTEMCVHHVATIILTLVSYQLAFTRVGSIVKLVMDPADVALHCAKLCLYASGDNKKSLAFFMADRFFELFAVTFFVTRLIGYGYVVWASYECAANTCSPTFIDFHPAGWFCISLLVLLLGLQIFWMSLLIRVAVKKLRNGGLEDIRSDSEDDEGDGDDDEQGDGGQTAAAAAAAAVQDDKQQESDAKQPAPRRSSRKKKAA